MAAIPGAMERRHLAAGQPRRIACAERPPLLRGQHRPLPAARSWGAARVALHAYSYVESSPLSRLDPLGLASVEPVYRPTTYAEVSRICALGALGCTQFGFNADCDCKSPKECWWFPRPVFTVTGTTVSYAEDCVYPEGIRGHEDRHVRQYARNVQRVEDRANDLSRQRFTDQASCKGACQQWLDGLKKQLGSGQRFIDVTRWPRSCATLW